VRLTSGFARGFFSRRAKPRVGSDELLWSTSYCGYTWLDSFLCHRVCWSPCGLSAGCGRVSPEHSRRFDLPCTLDIHQLRPHLIKLNILRLEYLRNYLILEKYCTAEDMQHGCLTTRVCGQETIRRYKCPVSHVVRLTSYQTRVP
jgi:hypothetical protein